MLSLLSLVFLDLGKSQCKKCHQGKTVVTQSSGSRILMLNCASNPLLVQFTLKSSKTDPFRKGVKVVIGRTGDELCPIAVLLAYLTHRGGAPGPLFLLPSGRPLLQRTFVSKVKETLEALGYPSAKYSGHSFHAGATTTAAAAGLQDSLIKILGRWESAAYQLYVRLPRTQLKGVSAALATSLR